VLKPAARALSITDYKRLPAAAPARHYSKLLGQITAANTLANISGGPRAGLGRGRIPLTVSFIPFVKGYKNSRKL